MRKKLKMRAGGSVKKYAEGGSVEPRRSFISNNPVGTNIARGRTPVGATRLEEFDQEKPLEVEVTAPREEALPTPPIPPRRPVRQRPRPSRAPRMSEADILNERSLEAARAGRNMYKRGGKVKK